MLLLLVVVIMKALLVMLPCLADLNGE